MSKICTVIVDLSKVKVRSPFALSEIMKKGGPMGKPKNTRGKIKQEIKKEANEY